jgi:hypothetical protein
VALSTSARRNLGGAIRRLNEAIKVFSDLSKNPVQNGRLSVGHPGQLVRCGGATAAPDAWVHRDTRRGLPRDPHLIIKPLEV